MRTFLIEGMKSELEVDSEQCEHGKAKRLESKAA